MSSSLVRVNGAEVATDARDRTVINITINQGSSLAYLMESVKSLGKSIGPLGSQVKPGNVALTDEQKMPGNVFKGKQKMLGVAQMVLGLVVLAFGILFCTGPFNDLYWSGVLFWTGAPFILSGAVSVLSERRPTRCWLLLAPWMNLVSFAVSIAGIVFLAMDLGWKSHGEFWYKELCEDRRSSPRMNDPTPRYDFWDEDKWRLNNCKQELRQLNNLAVGVDIILMVMMILVLCITCFSVIYAWKTLCCNKSSQQTDDIQVHEDSEPFLSPPEAHPPPYEEKIQHAETV
ncbi:transmembrane protein 176B-like [Rhinatrema bivittatum]|uniref:transmembrane protein 176B-like n=1 Tax=Rhinatrema bivittatum TaxID=194408 RepID=UPI00112CE91B|nr:transmembrane protein 176B-like [Rhinatrema bivittatum]